MAEQITQDNRLLAITTPAGKDVLLLNSFAGTEGLSRPFRYSLKMVADVQNNMPPKVKTHDLVGKPFTIRIKLSDRTGADAGERYICGLCERFSKDGQDDEFGYYTAVIVPWFSFLGYASNCRIFQDKAVPDIIKQVVSDLGYSAYFRSDLTKSYTTWDYCVQYRETDFAFLSRLMEQEGMYYYFEHTNGKHVMVLADAPSCYKPLPEKSDFKFAPVTGQDVAEDTIRSWRTEEEIHTGKWTARDFHHEMPHNFMEVTEQSPDVADEGKKFEVFDYPGDYAKKFNKPESRLGDVRPEGEKLDRLRIQQPETHQLVMSGASRGRTFSTGYKINVTGGDAAGSYLLTDVEHKAVQQPAYRSRENVGVAYDNRFFCIKSSTQYVPLQRNPKPVAYGLDTAFVIDETPSGNTEEIWPDKYGRVRVRFHWDREEKYACWLRVVQPWAGKMWGHQWIPRVTDEVMVSFLHGDPDCPIIVGSVYNKDNMPVFELPTHKTQAGIKTHSSKNGGSNDFNMLRFEDLKGSEEVYFQAQKDHNTLIKNDETRQVKNNRTTTIHVNDARTVETGNDTIDVQQGNRTITVDQGNISETASVGSITITASANSITINGATQITLQCGASTIKMTPANISINSPMVLINS